MSILTQIAEKIVSEQALIIGDVAWEEATRVRGLNVIDKRGSVVEIESGMDESKVVDDLVNRYTTLFGRAAREACREAASPLIPELPPDQVPLSIR